MYDIWALDEMTSPCIDRGNPVDDYSNEREPNGGLINMGAYGGTPQASLSLLRPLSSLDKASIPNPINGEIYAQ
jgi:hypothetical protein